jgi:hypothetical protein
LRSVSTPKADRKRDEARAARFELDHDGLGGPPNPDVPRGAHREDDIGGGLRRAARHPNRIAALEAAPFEREVEVTLGAMDFDDVGHGATSVAKGAGCARRANRETHR